MEVEEDEEECDTDSFHFIYSPFHMLITEKYIKDNIIPGQELSAKSLRLYCVRGEPLHMFTAMNYF